MDSAAAVGPERLLLDYRANSGNAPVRAGGAEASIKGFGKCIPAKFMLKLGMLCSVGQEMFLVGVYEL